MTIAELLKRALDDETYVQYISDCAFGAKTVKKKGQPPYTKVEIATQHMQVRDVVFPEEAQNVGFVVWIPRKLYEDLTGEEVK